MLQPKFKRGDVFQYRANIYRVQDIRRYANSEGFYYDVELLSPIVDPSDHVLSIGAAGEQDMKMVDPTDVVLDKFEERLFEIITYYLKTGESVTPYSIKRFAKQLKLLA